MKLKDSSYSAIGTIKKQSENDRKNICPLTITNGLEWKNRKGLTKIYKRFTKCCT